MSRSASVQTAGVSLFPFLAVLICTMGALILLLVIISRQAQRESRARAEQAAVSPVVERDPRRDELDDLTWRIEQLRSSHAATTNELAERRAELSDLEAQSRRLEDRLRALAAADSPTTAAADPAAPARDELASLAARLSDARFELERVMAEEPPPVYSVVPYAGPNGTHRRPLYIECRADAVILQPEGVELTAEHFDGPLGPGNPLAAALRAAREYLHDGGPDGEPSDPYPLFLVRPDGIASYYVAREAMESWGREFGYELIETDWPLAFPQADERLKEIERRAVAEAQAHQRRLVLAAPRSFRGARGSGRDRDRATRGTGGDRFSAEAFDARGQMRELPGYYDGRSGGSTRLTDTEIGESFEPRSTRGGAGDQSDGTTRPASKAAGAVGNLARRTAEGWYDQAAQPEGSAPGEQGLPAHAEMSPRRTASSSARRLADERGRDWGLKRPTEGAFPVTRPIRIHCRDDRLTVVGDGQRGSRDRVIPFDRETESAVDPLVEAVHEHVEVWGIAGRDMYWRPILVMEVAPDADERFADLGTLLEDSGLDVRKIRRGPPEVSNGR